MEKNNAAVYVRNANKSYGSKQILDSFSMTVQKGSIYGLLGASGCGKTTLLSCIVGRKKFDSGEVWVLGGKPGSPNSGVPGPKVGYMPQDVALVAEFSIRDSLFYFGRIFRMSDKEIEQRLEELSLLLDLPPSDRFVGNCSGGQQRRVSFAVALLNNPELLILDEPTVGLDPVLRDKIWNHLVELAENRHVSIIITTHYIEETRQAHRIGLLRQGKLLAEESPETLLKIFKTETLEEVFYILSQRQAEGVLEQWITARQNGDSIDKIYRAESEDGSINTLNVGSTCMLTPTKKEKKPTPILSSLNGHRLKALFNKNWKQIYRNLSGLSFMMIFPVIQMCAFLLAVGGDIQNIKIAIVNEENNFTTCNNFSINGTTIYHEIEDSCEYHKMGCRFLETINTSMIEQVNYDDIEKAVGDIKTGAVTGALHIPKNFSFSLEERIRDLRGATNDILDSSQVEAYMDMSNRQIGATIKFSIMQKVVDLQKDVLAECGNSEKVGEAPIRFEEYLFGEKDESFVIFMIPGALITMIFFMGTTNTSTIIISDRLEGVWDRSIVAGVTSAEILLTHFVTQFVMIFLQAALILAITFVVFQHSFVGSLFLITLIVILQGLCGMAYGFWVSVVCTNHSAANLMSTGVFYPMIVTCGFVWPIESMPLVLRWISLCLPFTIPILSLRNVIKKGWSITNLAVLNGIGVEIAWFFLLAIICGYLLKKSR